MLTLVFSPQSNDLVSSNNLVGEAHTILDNKIEQSVDVNQPNSEGLSQIPAKNRELSDLTTQLLQASDSYAQSRATAANIGNSADKVGFDESDQEVDAGAVTNQNQGEQILNELKTIAEKRQNLMIQALSEDRAADVLKVTLPKEIRASLPREVQPYLESEVKTEGRLTILHFDPKKKTKQKATYFYLLDTSAQRLSGDPTLSGLLDENSDDTTLDLHFAAKSPMEDDSQDLTSGARIQVSGVQVGKAVALANGKTNLKVLTPVRSSTRQSVRKLLAILVQSPKYPLDVTPAQVQDMAFDGARSTNKFFQEASYGNVRFEGKVVGPYEISDDDIEYCTVDNINNQDSYRATYKYINIIARHSINAARRAGVEVSGYDHTSIFLYGPCNFRGYAVIGGKITWVNDAKDLALTHELGHNLGLQHSHGSYCALYGRENNGPLGDCGLFLANDYDDIADVMGSGNFQNEATTGNSPAHFNAAQKDRLGWLGAPGFPPMTIVNSVTKDGKDYAISTYETPGSTPHALKIRRTPNDEWGKSLYVELRQPIGFDSNFLPALTRGVIIHQATPNPQRTFLLDTSAYPYFALFPGQSYKDPLSGIQITQKSLVDGVATVHVARNNPPTCIHQKPSVEIFPLNQFGNPGTRREYALTVTNNDVISCGVSYFKGSVAVPHRWDVSGFESMTLAQGESGNTILTVVASMIAEQGSYDITATATNEVDAKASGSATAAFLVPNCTRQKPTLTVTPTSQAGPAGSWLSYTGTVTNNDVGCFASQININVEPVDPPWFLYDFSSDAPVLQPGEQGTIPFKIRSIVTASPRTYNMRFRAINFEADSRFYGDFQTIAFIVTP